MKEKIARAKKFAHDHQFALGILAGGAAYALGRGDFCSNVVKNIPSDAPDLLIKNAHVKYLLSEDGTILFEHPIANLILHAEPK